MYKIKFFFLLINLGWMPHLSGHSLHFFCEPDIQQILTSDPSDCNLNNGTIEIQAIGSNGPLEYSIDGGVNWQASPLFANLPAGAYIIIVRNADGSCAVQYSNPVALAGPDSPRFIQVDSTDPTTCENNDGTISIFAEGGTGPYQYSIDNGNSWDSNSQIMGLSPGTYTVMVRNADGTCPTSYIFPVILNPVSPPIIIEVSIQSPSDCDLNDGVFHVIATNGNGGLEYSIDNGLNWQNNSLFTNVSPGVYQIKIRNANGTCEVTYGSAGMPALSPPTIIAVIPTNPSDCNVHDGSIQIQAEGSMTPLQYSVNGGLSWQFDPLFINLEPGSYQIEVRNENASCQITHSGQVLLEAPPLPQIININSSDNNDCGAANGHIQIEAIGGNPGLEYSVNGGNQWQSQATFPNLEAGNYTIQVRNQDGSCMVELPSPVLISEPTLPSIGEVTYSNPSDCGLSDGQINILAYSPDATAFEYSIDNGQSWHQQSTFEQLPEGSYLIMIRNLDGTCPINYSVPINLVEPTPPNIQGVNQQNPSDCNTPDGSIQVSTFGNTALEYSIDGGNTWQIQPDFEQLEAGSYFVSVRNANGTCEINYEEAIILESPLSPIIQDVIFTHPSDCGLANGTIQIFAADGSGSFDFSIDAGQNWQGLGEFINLAEGVYNIRIRNSDETCLIEFNQPIELIEPQPPIIDQVTAIDPSDCELSDGSIQMTSLSGNDPYEYSIDAGQSWQTQAEFINLPGGSYSPQIRNVDGTCAITDLDIIELIAPSPPVIESVESTAPSDCDIENGFIQIQTAPSISALEYSIDGGNSWSNESGFFNLPGGSYQVVVRMVNSICPATTFESLIQLTTPSQPNFTDIQFSPITNCGLADGSISTTAAGDAGSFLYGLQLPSGATIWQTTPQFVQLPEGDYLPLLRNIDNSCQISYFEHISIESLQAPIIAAIAQSHPSNCGLTDGHISVDVADLSADVLYSINGGQSWQNESYFDNLGAGIYTVQVSNADGTCVVDAENSVNLLAPDPPEFEVNFSSPTDCGVANGEIIISSNNTANLQYSIDGGQNWSGTPSFTQLSDGIYDIFVRYTDGSCLTPYGASIQLMAPLQPQFILHTSPITDCGLSDGSIEIVIASGSGFYEFSIDNGNTWSTDAFFNNLTQGNYQISVRNEDGNCPTQAQELSLEGPALPSIQVVTSSDPTNCGLADGSISIITTNNNEDYNYSIDNGQSWQNNSLFSDLGSGIYQIMVQNQDGSCRISHEPTITLSEPTPPVMELVSSNPSDCGSTDGSIQINIINGEVSDYQFFLFGENVQSSNYFSDLPAGNYQIFAISSSTICPTSFEANVQLDAPTMPVFSFEYSDPANCESNDGSIHFLVNGLSNNYDYSIDNGTNWQTSPAFGTLNAASYQLKVRNADGSCPTEAITLILHDPAYPQISVEFQAPTDCDQNDGRIIIQSINDGNYEFSINNGQDWTSNSEFQDLAPGAYNLLARNADGTCTINYETPIILFEPTPPTVDLSFQQPTDCFIENGVISISASGGNGAYEFSIDGGNNWTLQSTFQNLGAGVYQVKVRNADGTCPVDFAAPIILEQPEAPQIETTFSNPTDCGEMNGIIVITPSNTVNTYEYSIDNGISWSNNHIFSGLNNGSYQPALRQTNGTCFVQSEESIQLTSPGAPMVELISGNPTDCVLENGWIQIFASGGTGAFEFSHNNGMSWQSSPIFTPLNPGLYQISVRNDDGTCLVNYSQTIEISTPEPLVFQASANNPTACGTPDGTITIAASGGTGNYEYSIDNGQNWQTSSAFSNLSAGNYSLSTRNNDGTCESDINQIVTLSSPAPMPLQVMATDPSDCSASDGTISITLSNFIEGQEYSINAGQSWQTSPYFLELPEGVYHPVARNQDGGCESVYDTPIELVAPMAPVFEVISNAPTDCNFPNGFISIHVFNNNTALGFSIDNGINWQAAPNFINLASGTYHIKVRNENGSCETDYFQDVILQDPATFDLQIAIDAYSPTDCGAENGRISISSLNENRSLEYSLDNGLNWSDQDNFHGLPAGIYQIKIRPVNDECENDYEELIILEAPELPEISQIEFSNPSNCGLDDGRIEIMDLIAINNFQYSIDGGNTWQNQPIFNDLPADLYQVVIRNTEGNCLKTMEEPIELTSPSLPQIQDIQFSHPSGCGLEDGQILFQTGHPLSPIQYSIDNGESWSFSSSFENLTPGIYHLKIKNADGNCEEFIEDSIELLEPELPQIESVLFESPNDCAQTNGSISIQLVNPSANFQYSIDGGNTWSAQHDYPDLSPGEYLVAVQHENGNCRITYPNPILFESISPMEIQLAETISPSCLDLEDGMISISVEGGEAPYNFNWSNGQHSDIVNNLSAGSYNLTVTDTRNCEAYLQDIQLEIGASVSLELGQNIDTTVCLGQSVDFAFSDSTLFYSWTSNNGFSSDSSAVSLNQSGTYWLEVTNEAGCSATDSININYLEAFFDADFLLPTDGVIDQSIVAIDISWPIPDSIRWEYNPDSIWHQESISNHEIVSFPETGIYHIRLYAYHGACYGIIDKTISIHATTDSLNNQELQMQTSNIIAFNLFPNPNQGTFDVSVGLDSPQAITLWIFREDGLALDTRQLHDSDLYFEHYHFANLQPGLYTLVLQSQSEWLHLNFVVE